MAFLQCSYFSSVLGLSMQMNVFLPQAAQGQIGMGSLSAKKKKFPCLYLLHGLSDDHSIWQRRTSLERYVADLPLAIVMPNGFRGFYTNAKRGPSLETALTEELISVCEGFFPLVSNRAGRFVGGLSMGGYGAMKFGLKHPHLYSKVLAFSGVLDMAEHVRLWRKGGGFLSVSETEAIFGQSVDPSEDLFALARALKKKGGPWPPIRIACGTGDFLYADNVKFKKHLESLGIAFEYYEGPGVHDWAFWDEEIRKSLKFLMGRQK